MKFLIILISVTLAHTSNKDLRLSKHFNEADIVSYIIGG